VKHWLTALILFGLFLIHSVPQAQSQNAPPVVINEIAWAGTAASAADEWIELYNPTTDAIDLTGWTLRWDDKIIHFGDSEDGSNTIEVFNTTILARGYYLLERTDNDVIVNVDADLTYGGVLRNGGESLALYDSQGNLVDTANAGAASGWIAGADANGEVPFASMERIDPRATDTPENWAGNNGLTRTGVDAAGGPINGTPKARNSAS